MRDSRFLSIRASPPVMTNPEDTLFIRAPGQLAVIIIRHLPARILFARVLDHGTGHVLLFTAMLTMEVTKRPIDLQTKDRS